MNKILFVTTRNVLTSSGELRLIKNRAESLFHEYGIITDIIAIQKPERICTQKKEVFNAGGWLRTFPAKYSKPIQSFISYRKAYKTVVECISTGKYSTIIFSGSGFESWVKKIKKISNVKVLFDIHGANEDLLEVAQNSGFIKKVVLKALYYKLSFFARRYLYRADGALVVTEALEEYTRSRYTLPENFKFYIIPCATSALGFENDEYHKFRLNYRQKYGLKDNEIAFIYSGGISPWQCIEETIEVYKLIKSQINQKTKLLIFSFNIDAIKHLLVGLDVIHDSYTSEELPKALCAGDYAFLLRRDTLTNNVAFPNKFLEYVQSGMRIITTPYVYEISKQIDVFELGTKYDFSDNLSEVFNYIESRENNWCYEKNTVDKVLKFNSFKKRVEGLARDIMSNK